MPSASRRRGLPPMARWSRSTGRHWTPRLDSPPWLPLGASARRRPRRCRHPCCAAWPPTCAGSAPCAATRGCRPAASPRARATPGWCRGPARTAARARRRYGPVFTIRLMHVPVVWAMGAEATHQMLVTEFDAFEWRSGRFTDLWPLLGDGMLNIDGDYHREMRRLLLPAFHRERVEAVADTMIEEGIAAAEALRPGTTLDVYHWARELALRIAMRALLGMDAGDHRERALAARSSGRWTSTRSRSGRRSCAVRARPTPARSGRGRAGPARPRGGRRAPPPRRPGRRGARACCWRRRTRDGAPLRRPRGARPGRHAAVRRATTPRPRR